MQICENQKEVELQLAKVSYHPKDNIWFLREKYSYPDKDKKSKIIKSKIILDECFYFDLASIPRFFWRIIAIHELSIEATLIHDFMYMSRGGTRKCHKGKKIKGRIEFKEKLEKFYSREEADKLFLKMMEELKVNKYRRFLSYIGVRIFGLIFWRPDWLDNFFQKLLSAINIKNINQY